MTTSSSPLYRRFRIGALCASAIVAGLVLAQPAVAAEGLRVSGTRVVESNGNAFIMRGVNHPHAWFASRTSAFADIKSFRSNVVRVVLSGGRWTTNGPADVANVVSLCKANRMICVLENHDTTGYGEDGAAYSLDQAVDYFATLQGVLAGQEDYVIINPGNEPIGNNNATQWISATTSAIQRLRSLGFEHLIMIDAPNWGQDWQYVMRDSAQTIWASDPNANLVFSIHMYGVFNTASAITSYLNTFRDAGLPLVIGEFGYRNNNSANVDHDTVMAEAEARGMGYIGWSWSGNNDPYLDMTIGFDKNNLSPWGQRFLNGANGVVATAREATIFGTGTSYGLTVARAGTGSGTVSGGGITCGSTCTASFPSGTSVTLTATSASGSTFTGWSGACVGTSGTCTVSMTAARTVTATFNAVSTSYSLTVARAGTGSGTVTGPSINCGSTCTSAYAGGTSVTLTAAAASGSSFASWSGCASSSGTTCTVSMTQNRAVTATFNTVITGNTLTVNKAGTGSGTVTSSTGGINCGSACSATFTSGTSVTLTATAASGSTFASWSGCTSSSGTRCTVSMTQARTVTATFNTTSTSYALTVSKTGSGGGTVTSNTGGLNCGTACSATFTSGTTVTLTATPASGSTFASWSGCTSSSGTSCIVSMTAARAVTATFDTSGGGTTPCANAITFTGNTNNFNTTGAVCYRTTQTINGWGCYNMDGRTLSVNNTTIACGQMPMPAKWSDGYTYFSVTAGTYPWAGIYAW